MLEDCSGKLKEPVPWKEVIPRYDQLIPPPYLPDGKKICEPSQMNRHEATELLDFCKADKEVKPPVFDTSPTEDHPAVTLPKEKPGRKGMAATRTGRKSTVHVVIPPESSDEEDEGEEEQQAPKAKSVQKKVVWSIKEMKRGSKRQPTSKSRQETDASDDKFNDPDSSEEDSGDDVPAVGGRKKTQPAKQTAAASKTKPKAAQPSSRAEEPSASQVPPTPLEKPRQKRSRDDDSHESPEKRIWVEKNSKKCPAGDAVQESLAKCTRSKTAEVPQKRSKKPNSRYTDNFVKS
ncbi:hypothetical protein P692DRAFT_20878746 [Suillus brevipes Sb2]|nr:hypothetical protein P692DRAFT_20878746 [Suillus brevipes Sb2]